MGEIPNSRGDSPSSYMPGSGGSSGIKSYLINLKAQAISGTCISAGVAYAVSHQLGKVPAAVLFSPKLVAADAVTTVSAGVVGEANASAMTSAKFYVIGNKDGIKYRAFVIV